MFKSHSIVVYAGVDEKCPIHECDRLIPQIIVTLNLLQQSNVSPNVSAYAHHHGQYKYHRMPLAPMGCTVQFRESAIRRRMSGERSADGWYLLMLPEHDQFYKV